MLRAGARWGAQRRHVIPTHRQHQPPEAGASAELRQHSRPLWMLGVHPCSSFPNPSFPLWFIYACSSGPHLAQLLQGDLASAPSRIVLGARTVCRLPQQVAAKGLVAVMVQWAGCQQIVQLRPCERGPASTQPRYCPFSVTSLQPVIKTSGAACQGSANSQAEQDLSQEAPAKLQAAAAAAAAAAVMKAEEKNLQLDPGPQNPGHRLWLLQVVLWLIPPSLIFAPKSSRSIGLCLSRYRQEEQHLEAAAGAVRWGGVSPASWNPDPWNFFLCSSSTRERRCLQITELKCFLKLKSGGIQSQGYTAHLEDFIWASSLLVRKGFCPESAYEPSRLG